MKLLVTTKALFIFPQVTTFIISSSAYFAMRPSLPYVQIQRTWKSLDHQRQATSWRSRLHPPRLEGLPSLHPPRPPSRVLDPMAILPWFNFFLWWTLAPTSFLRNSELEQNPFFETNSPYLKMSLIYFTLILGLSLVGIEFQVRNHFT